MKFLKIKEKEVGRLFGIKGCKINEITKIHKVFIDAQSTIDSFRIIDIDGIVENIFKAATEIIKIVGFENCIILEEIIIMAAEKFNKIQRDTEETRFDAGKTRFDAEETRFDAGKTRLNAESKPPEDNKMKSDSINKFLKEINDSDNLMIFNLIMINNTTYSISTELLSQIFSNMKKQ
ncbi:hypothetical protein PVAND_011030 [Polypedilum vanderplanki]|uniref:K Homology domain-containing protein n=1 Tax=Polypedilum vanderplanki TaxID=319348 RepID=A0A9J6CJ72_POLVA|nr:hypothetical protein PVAND_011030 [Polypedilum vanderplanki]